MTKERSRLSWLYEGDSSVVLMLAPVVRWDRDTVVVLLAFGPWRAGVAWRRK